MRRVLQLLQQQEEQEVSEGALHEAVGTDVDLSELDGIEPGDLDADDVGAAFFMLTQMSARELHGEEMKQMLPQLSARAVELAPQMEPEELPALLWVLGRLGLRDPALIEALVREAAPKLGLLSSQDLANMAWALGMLEHADCGFMTALLEEARPRLAQFAPLDLANLAWAVAFTGGAQNNEDFLAAFVAAAAPKLPEFSALDLANTAWALAKLGFVDKKFTTAFVGEAKGRAEEFSTQDMQNLAWALPKLGCKDKKLLAAVAPSE